MPRDSPSPALRPPARVSGQNAPASRPSWPVIRQAVPSPPSRDHGPGLGNGPAPWQPAQHRAGERPRSLLAEISQAVLQDSMDRLADLDLDVQRLIGGHVELVEHLINSMVTGGLTLGTRRRAQLSAGLVRVLTADRGVLDLAVLAAAAFLAVLLAAAAFLRGVLWAERSFWGVLWGAGFLLGVFGGGAFFWGVLGAGAFFWGVFWE